MRGVLPLVVALAIVLGARDAGAHDLRPGVLTLRELGDGDYALRLVAPVDSRGDARDVTIAWPPGCERAGDRLRCEPGGGGRLRIDGLRGPMRMIVIVVRADGERAEWVLDADTRDVDLVAAPPSGVLAWLRLGVAHILSGFDHLAFVLGLLLVLELRLDRRLLLTITAFTLAHSCTLALAALGVLTVRAAPVEACIALSVLLVAREATHREPTAIRRWPWLAAGGFGLVHGLGFASALADVGLPRASLVPALVSFNAGVELGQLAVVAALVALVALGRRLVDERGIVRRHVHRAACYALGALAAWWLLARLFELACGAR